MRERVAAGVAGFAAAHEGRVPGLATVLVGDDPASQVYVGNKRRLSEEVGMRSIHHEPAASISTEELVALVGELNGDEGRRDPRAAPAAGGRRSGRGDLRDRLG